MIKRVLGPDSSADIINLYRDVDSKVLSLLEFQIPRYTSYPSAHHFQDINHSLPELWLNSLPTDQSIGLYIHIPFCPKLCWYCGCHTKMTYRYEPIEAYIALLLEEFKILAAYLPHRPKLHSLHFGGGSPTILDLKDLTRLFYAIESNFEISKRTEISIEIDPRHLTRQKAKIYAELGINRASLGVQDFNKKVQEAINRIQPFNLVLEATALLRDYGIYNINLDLIYGLPFQTLHSIKDTVQKVLSLKPNRIAYFSYAHMPWMKKHQRLIPSEALPDTLEKIRFYTLIQHLLEESEYKSIGIDHFAKEEDDLFLSLQNRTLRRNFMGYTPLPNDYSVGVGVSSISELRQGFAQNSIQFAEYKKRIQEGHLPTARGWTYVNDDQVRKTVISQLMCYFEADLNDILSYNNYPLNYFDRELSQLKDLETMNIVSVENRRIRFRSTIPMLIRYVSKIFDSYAKIEGKTLPKIA